MITSRKNKLIIQSRRNRFSETESFDAEKSVRKKDERKVRLNYDK